MLSNLARSFIIDEMAIDISSIEERLIEPDIIEYRDDIEEAISEAIEIIIAQKESGMTCDMSSLEDIEAENSINNYFRKASKKITSEKAKWTLDSLRHAFVSFALNGLHQLYTCQENETWYPKVVLKEVLEPNDIDALDNEFVIYRGCNKSELNSRNFGQSWSTSEETAHKFAFKHYESQDWFQKENRIVLRAIYCKSEVLFSDQTEYGEYEIAVKIDYLKDVALYST